MVDPICLESMQFECEMLMTQHPPRWFDSHKKMIFDHCRAAGYTPSGTLKYSRWKPQPLPEQLPAASPNIDVSLRYYDYESEGDSVWHVNFADPYLFIAYGSSLLAQDEMQALEHPILGSLREALLKTKSKPVTDGPDGPTPVLVQNAERVCVLDTTPSQTSPRGLYGNRFQVASPEAVMAALHVIAVPTKTNLIAMAAPRGNGRYTRQQIASILSNAYSGYRAAGIASATSPLEIHTGFWGCGAFGGNRQLMTLLQLLAARLANVQAFVFHLGGPAEQPVFEKGREILSNLVSSETAIESLIDRITALEFRWGQSDGN